MTNLSKKRDRQSAQSWIQETLNKGDAREVRALFAFNAKDSDEQVLFKLHLWTRWFFPNFFHVDDAPFHAEMDRRDLAVYRGTHSVFVNAAFRGAAKTTRTKLFLAFCVANDMDHRHRYIKTLSEDYKNARQNVTDVYNLLISARIKLYYPEIFEKTDAKREETMAGFTTSTGVKMQADSVGMGQRGDIQEDARPSFLWFEDFENRKVLRSAVVLQSIWDNMEEARTGLARHGGAIYNCNYLSERGNVHKLVEKYPRYVLITPIRHNDKPTWLEAYTPEAIKRIEETADDFAGEYMQQPSAGADIFFDRESLERQPKYRPRRVVGGFKIFYEYNASHRYGSGHDIGGGVGLDSSTSVFIDFTPLPNRVVATYKNNLVKPDIFGDEIAHQGDMYGECIMAPESNSFGAATIGRLKQLYENIFTMEQYNGIRIEDRKERTYGWHTNVATKPTILMELRKAVEDGLLQLTDPDLIAEMRAYTRDDLMDRDLDPRLATRHFDLLIACAIAWQMRNHAQKAIVHSEVDTGKTSKDFDVY